MKAASLVYGLVAFGGIGTVIHGAFLLFHWGGPLTPYLLAVSVAVLVFTPLIYWVAKASLDRPS